MFLFNVQSLLSWLRSHRGGYPGLSGSVLVGFDRMISATWAADAEVYEAPNGAQIGYVPIRVRLGTHGQLPAYMPEFAGG